MKSKIHKQLRFNLKHFRSLRGLSQEALATLAGVSQSTVAQCESGRRNISVTAAQRLSRVLNVKWQALFENPKK